MKTELLPSVINQTDRQDEFFDIIISESENFASVKIAKFVMELPKTDFYR